MNRLERDALAPYDFVGHVIRIEADALARHRGLDPERVRRVLARTAIDAEGRPLAPASPLHDNLANGLQFSPSLDEALEYLSSDVALSLFEQIDPFILSRRCALAAYLADPFSPFYTLDELADMLTQARRHLNKNRESLIETGYPGTSFASSPWLDWHLIPLSPIKVPVKTLQLPADSSSTGLNSAHVAEPVQILLAREERRLPADDSGNLIYSYVWSREPSPPVWTTDGPLIVRSMESRAPVAGAPYADAALLAGLTTEVADKLENSRLTFFQVKQAIIEACVRCLSSRDPQSLWPSVSAILADGLPWEDAQRYLAVEDLYWRAGVADLFAHTLGLEVQMTAPGTLSELLGLVGHVEKELRIGTFDKTSSTIGRAWTASENGTMASYFQAVGHESQHLLDAALDGFRAMEQQEHGFWDEFQQRVNTTLEHELRQEIIIQVRIRRGLVARFEPTVRTFAEWQRAQLESTGTIAQLHLVQPDCGPTTERSVFHKLGTTWTLGFGGHTVHLQHRKGMHYIAYLLRHPHREFHVLDLVAAVDGNQDGEVGPYSTMDANVLAELDLNVATHDHGEPILDSQARAEYRQRMADLREELDEAMRCADLERASDIQQELDFFVKQLTAAYGLGGRVRRSGSSAERARTNVRKLIESARRQIADSHPRLAHHLEAIKTGTYCSYTPDPTESITWDIHG